MDPSCTWNPPLEATRDGSAPGRAAAEDACLDRARRDPEAFAELYRRHHAAVARCVQRRVADPGMTEEIVSDVFFAALSALPRYQARGVPLRHWLLRIASRAVSRHARSERRFTRALVRVQELGVDERCAAPGPDPVARVRAALARLAPWQQEVLTLHHLEGLSVCEVARAQRCREGTVKSRLARARVALRERLEQLERNEQ